MTTDEKLFMTHAKTINMQRWQTWNLMQQEQNVSTFTPSDQSSLQN